MTDRPIDIHYTRPAPNPVQGEGSRGTWLTGGGRAPSTDPSRLTAGHRDGLLYSAVFTWTFGCNALKAGRRRVHSGLPVIESNRLAKCLRRKEISD
jgi:hypothetical protein